MPRISHLSPDTAATTRQQDEPAGSAFIRVYPVIADQILERTGITRGTCLEVGSGPALLGISLALLSKLRVTALDNAPAMLELAKRNIRDRCVDELVVPAIGDVHAIPATDATFDLVVSRGSFGFWHDLPLAFREIHRVLKPSGVAYIGGGFGNARIRDEVMADRGRSGYGGEPDDPRNYAPPRVGPTRVLEDVAAAGITEYRIIDDDSGFWVVFCKKT